MNNHERRFFLLREPFTANEADDLLGRLVVSKTSPLDKFAPFSDPTRPAHKTNDILPSILPKPDISTRCDQTITVAREHGLTVQLSALLSFNLSRTKGETRRLESELVKKYTLQSPQVYFQQLMQDDDYAQDARELIASTSSGRVYLVTGFITASEATWTIENTASSGNGFNATIPIGIAAGLPSPGLDAGFGVNGSNSNTSSHTRHVSEEQIFAISYSVVKLSTRFNLLSKSTARTPVVSHPKKAKPYHLAMSNESDGDDEELDWCSEDEDAVVTTSKPSTLSKRELEVCEEDAQESLENQESSCYLNVI